MPKPKVEYVIIREEQPADLTIRIRDRLSENWDLYGTPFTQRSLVVNGSYVDHICQALVRVTEVKRKR